MNDATNAPAEHRQDGPGLEPESAAGLTEAQRASPAQGEPLTDEQQITAAIRILERWDVDDSFGVRDAMEAFFALVQGEPHAGSAERQPRVGLPLVDGRVQRILSDLRALDRQGAFMPGDVALIDETFTIAAALTAPPQAGANPSPVDVTGRDSTAIRRAADE